MAQQILVNYKNEEYVFNPAAYQYECQHINVEIEPDFCNGEACACPGTDLVTCNNESCTGIDEEEMIRIWEAYKIGEYEE